jgi:hypothetical protein
MFMAILFKIISVLILLEAIGIASGTDMPDVAYMVSGSDPGSSEDLSQYQEYYSVDPGSQAQAGPTQYMVSGSEPESLVIGGQSRPYDPSSIPVNSLWIQGSSSWTQYIKCPLGATFRMLAFSYGGPVTMEEVYPDGYQLVNRYNFYPDYTRLIFEADAVGRHTLSFSTRGLVSNTVVVDVLPYSSPRSYGPGYSSTVSSGWSVTHTGGQYGSQQGQYEQDSEDGYGGWDQQI